MGKYDHPKWQKKRLEIMQRDGFKCQHCGEEDNTLVVHHRYYIKDRDIWDYDNTSLVTLCKSCHDEVHIKSEDENWGDYHPKYEMLNCNVDYEDIHLALTLYKFAQSPKNIREIVGIICNTPLFNSNIFVKYIEFLIINMITTPSCGPIYQLLEYYEDEYQKCENKEGLTLPEDLKFIIDMGL